MTLRETRTFVSTFILFNYKLSVIWHLGICLLLFLNLITLSELCLWPWSLAWKRIWHTATYCKVHCEQMLGWRQVLSLPLAGDLSDFPLGHVLRCRPLWSEIGAELIIVSQAGLLGNIQRTDVRVYYGQEFSKARNGTDTQPSRKGDSFLSGI